MRLFFALWPDDATRDALAAAAAGLSLRDGRPVARADLHLTLAFLGEVAAERLDALYAMAAAIALPAFELEIAMAGWWRRSRVVWLAPREIPTPLVALAGALQAGADLHAESPADYRPHVTIARRVRHVPGLVAGFSIPWQVQGFALIASNCAGHGARYRALAQWPLRGTVSD